MRNLIKSSGSIKSSIAFDIETRAHEDTDTYLDQYRTYEAPSNYRKQEAIDSYKEKARAKDRERAAIYVPTQRAWVICAEHVDTGEKVAFEHKNEKVVIEEFFEYLDSYPDHVIFGFNSRSFDVPCLYGAALRTCTPVPNQLRYPEYQSDVLDDFYHNKIRLQDLAHLMGMSKTMDGGEVGQSWLAYALENNRDERDRVVDYCHQDVHLCAEYVRRVYCV